MDLLKTREQLAHELGISTKTIQRRMKDAGIQVGKRLLRPDEQAIIIGFILGNRGGISPIS